MLNNHSIPALIVWRHPLYQPTLYGKKLPNIATAKQCLTESKNFHDPVVVREIGDCIRFCKLNKSVVFCQIFIKMWVKCVYF